jgi:PAS domain S-box-containing protein
VTESDFQTFEAVGALVVVLDVGDRIVHWNQACSDLTGYALEEVRGRRFWDFLLAPEEVEPVRSALAAARTGDRPSRVANYWITKAGERRWIAWSNMMTAGPDGRPRYCIKTGIDRTESKQAEDKLAGIIGIAADAIISIDDEQRIAMYNQGAETIFGWSVAEVMGKSLDILIPERFRHVHGQHVRGFASGEETARRMGERMPAIFGLRKSGEEFPAQAAISKLDVGGSRLFTVVLRDVTKEKRRDKDRELLADVAAALADTLDSDDALTRVAGLLVQELADFCIVDLIDRDGKLRRKKVIHRDPEKTTLCEMFQRLPVDGSHARIVYSVVESKQPRLMAEVPPQYLESVAQDDEHLRALHELDPRSLIVVPLLARGQLLGALVLVSSQPSRRYGDEDLLLAEEIASRTAIAVENARLYEDAWGATHDLREANQQMVGATIRAQEATEEAEAARARAERSERELREVAEFREMFIGILGHDLRNPLASIAMSASALLRSGRLGKQDENRVARITGSSARMLRMVSQLLDLTRARFGGGFPLEPRPTDLREVCRSVIEEFEKRIRLEVEGDVTGTWDPDRLAEALSNIAGNAIEHAAPGTAVVVKARVDGPEVVVEIINQGDPIPADVLPFIFEPFRRAKEHEKSTTGNLGLGLYIAKQIVQSGHGTLAAYSVDGTTTFLMRLPRHPPAAAQIQGATATEHDRRDGHSDRRAGARRHPG